MNKIAGLRNPWNSCGSEVPQKPKNDEDNDEKFEHERFLSIASARLTSVPLLGVAPWPKNHTSGSFSAIVGE